MDTASLIFWPVAFAAMALAAFSDLKYRLIPNFLVLVVLCAALGLRVDGGLSAAGLSLVATVIVTGVVYVIADRGYMGWGDAKMIAAASLLVPPGDVHMLMFCIVFAGGILSCVYVLARMALRRYPWGCLATATLPLSPGDLVRAEMARIVAQVSMPYGLAIWGGTSIWLMHRMIRCSFATYC